jgi:hypothetical protein
MRETVQKRQETIEDGGHTVTPCETLPTLMREVITGSDHVHRRETEMTQHQRIGKVEEKTRDIAQKDCRHHQLLFVAGVLSSPKMRNLI